jgi:hypothetical protein
MPSSCSSSPKTLRSLPSEILWNIITLLDPIDLSNARLVSKQLKKYCDHPTRWKNLSLDPPALSSLTIAASTATTTTRYSNANNSSISHDVLALWNLSDLKAILEPHLSLIQSIQIWGVRDNIIRYLILHCHNLQDLTILGWSTLSDHALRIPPSHQSGGDHQLSLRRLRLVGQQKSNFTSLDATTFAKLITRCPQLEELSVVSCQIHIQADSLLNSFDPTSSNRQNNYQQDQTNTSSTVNNTATSSAVISSLKSLTVATKRTWSSRNVTRLFQLCSNLQVLALVPDSKNIDVEDTSSSSRSPTTPIPVLDNNQPLLEKNVQSIEEQEMLEFDNIVIYSL